MTPQSAAQQPPTPLASVPPENDPLSIAGRQALARGLEWLAIAQGTDGDWETDDQGLVALATLAFLASGHLPERGKYGEVVQRGCDALLAGAQPSGLLCRHADQRAMLSHGQATLVLSLVHGMGDDSRFRAALDRALQVIQLAQCDDGGFAFSALRAARGEGLCALGAQAMALRMGVQGGLSLPSAALDRARGYLLQLSNARDQPEWTQEGASRAAGYFQARARDARDLCSLACEVVVWQSLDASANAPTEPFHAELARVMQASEASWKPGAAATQPGAPSYPLGACALYFSAVALCQDASPECQQAYSRLRAALVETQLRNPDDARLEGLWRDERLTDGKHSEVYSTAVACIALALPLGYLPCYAVPEQDDSY